MLVDISTKLFKNIEAYCSMNGLNVNEFIMDMLNRAFMKEKYGERPELVGNTSDKQEVTVSVCEPDINDDLLVTKRDNKCDVLENDTQKQEQRKSKKRQLN